MIKTIASDAKYENISLSDSELNQRLFDARINNFQRTDTDINTFIQPIIIYEQSFNQNNGFEPDTQQNLKSHHNLYDSEHSSWEHS